MRMLYLLPVLALVATGVPVMAAQQQSAPSTSADENGGTPAPKPTKTPKPRKICVEDESANSRMPQRTCHTQAEWDAINARGRTNNGNRDIPSRATQ